MSQNLGNPKGEGQHRPSHSSDESREGSRYEGFEGMNYEQRRPLYSPHQVNKGNLEGNAQNGQRRDEV
jgi:hypothetical protein